MQLLVPLPVVVPLAAAGVIAGFGKFVRSRVVDVTAILVAAAITTITALLLSASLRDTLTYWYGGWEPVNRLAIGIAFVVQPFGAALALLASVVTLLVMSFVLIMCGFLVKAAVVPFHFWLADAYAVAPAPAAVLFSAVMSDLGLYAVAEIYWTVFADPFCRYAWAIRAVLLTVGAVTGLVGAVMCASQRSLKRMLAFATISHIGLFLIGVALLEAVGLAGAILYLFCDGLVKGGLFLAAGVLAYRLRSGDELELHGRGRRLPVIGVAMALGGLALATLPPFGTFLGKALIEEPAQRVGAGWVPWVLLIAEAITGATVLRATGPIFLGLGPTQDPALSRQRDDEQEEEPRNRTGRNLALLAAPVGVLIASGLAVGLIPHPADAAASAAHRLVARPLHLGDTHDRAPLITTTAYLFGVGSTLGAVVLAAAALARPRLDRFGVRRATAVLRPAAQVLRALHSGHVGDYVTWLVLGVVAVGTTLVLTMTV